MTLVGALAAEAMADAIVRAATQAAASNGLPAARDMNTRAGAVQVAMSSRIDRRAFVQRSLASAAGLLSSRRLFAQGAPAIVQAEGSLPALPQGVAAGAAGPDRFVVWSRCDRPARMIVEYATTDRFTDVRRIQRVRRRSEAPTSPRGRFFAICHAVSGFSIACCSRTSRTSAVSALPSWQFRHCTDGRARS